MKLGLRSPKELRSQRPNEGQKAETVADGLWMTARGLHGGGLAEESCALLLGVITLPNALQIMRCARLECGRNLGEKRVCPGCLRQTNLFRSGQGMGDVGNLCRKLCAGQPGAPSARPRQFDSGVSVATGSSGLFNVVQGPVCVGSCTSACTSATSQASIVLYQLLSRSSLAGSYSYTSYQSSCHCP